MKYRIGYHARPFIFRTGFFYVLIIIGLPILVLAQPPKWDVDIFRSINDSRTTFLNAAIGGNDNMVLPFAIAVPALFGGIGAAEKDAYTFDSGLMVGLSEVSAFAVYYVLKNVVVKRERPYVALSDVHTMHLDTADKYSMPSGHTTAAFAIATALTLRYPKPYVYIPAFAWATFVGYGRIYMGLHYPSDVLAGAILGSASAFAIHLISPQVTKWREKILGDDLGVQLAASPVPGLLNLRISF